MKGTLTDKSTFKELKKYFDDNKEFLPETLDCNYIFYSDVKGTIDIYIHQVMSEAKRFGVKNIKQSTIAKSAKSNLFKLYIHLQNLEGWDVEREEIKNLNKYKQ